MKTSKRRVGPWIFVSINETVRETIELVEQAHLALQKIRNPPAPFETQWQVNCASGKYSFFVRFPGSALSFVNKLDLPRWVSLCEVAIRNQKGKRKVSPEVRRHLSLV